MIEKQKCIHVYSDLNKWIDLCILVNKEDLDKAEDIVDESYDDWFKNDSCDTLSDHILDSLTKNDIPYQVYYNIQNNIKEVEVTI